jgi:AcrR family transcriptional regulator
VKKSDVTKGEIEREALRAFCRLGFDKTNMRDIAASVGLPVSVLYYHHESKEALYTEVIYNAIVRLFADLRGLVNLGRHRTLVDIFCDLIAVRSPAALTDEQLALYRISILEWMGHRGETALCRKLRAMIAENRSQLVLLLAQRLVNRRPLDHWVIDMLYRYMEFETISMLFGTEALDRARVKVQLQRIIGPE